MCRHLNTHLLLMSSPSRLPATFLGSQWAGMQGAAIKIRKLLFPTSFLYVI